MNNSILIFLAVTIPILAIFGSIAVFVYRDAKKRGMNPWLWALVSLFGPNFIGLIIYLIVRSNYGKKCLSCGKQVNPDFQVCPYCGSSLKEKCSKCGREVASDWNVCPHCNNELVSK